MTQTTEAAQTAPTQEAAPFTPSELAAPNPALHRAMNARLEALLAKHEPTMFRLWVARMEAEGEGPAVSRWWGPSLFHAAAVMVTRQQDLDNQDPGRQEMAATFYDTGCYATDRRFQRNRDLLIKLVLRGVVRRGEATRIKEAKTMKQRQ